MNRTKERRQLKELLEAHGMTIEQRGNGNPHYVIMKGSKAVASNSHSPSDPHAFRQTVRVLVRQGLLPESAKRVKF